mgnify:CR=1 FL=1
MNNRIITQGFGSLYRVLREQTAEQPALIVNISPLTPNSSLYDFAKRWSVTIELAVFHETSPPSIAYPGAPNGTFLSLVEYLGEDVANLLVYEDLVSLMDESKLAKLELNLNRMGGGTHSPFLLLAKDPQQFPKLIELAKVHCLKKEQYIYQAIFDEARDRAAKLSN